MLISMYVETNTGESNIIAVRLCSTLGNFYHVSHINEMSNECVMSLLQGIILMRISVFGDFMKLRPYEASPQYICCLILCIFSLFDIFRFYL